MDLVASSSHHQQLCYVRCSFCNTVLAVGIPLKQTMKSSVTVKCGHCSNLSFLSTTPPPSLHNYNASHHHRQGQGICSEKLEGRASSSSSSSSFKPTSDEAAVSSSKAASTFVVKPPDEKKHRLPSAYNRFMKEEIQRIKAANPEITHREAFSAAAKNWAIPNSPTCRSSGGSTCNNP